MALGSRVCIGVVLAVCYLLIPPLAAAQQSSSIAGVVRDETGAVLPGVTVEAASPALIERVRSAVTDGQGRYEVVDLRPGAYAMTFTLVGFSTVVREGVELRGAFTSTINVEMAVGAVEETITVTGESPLVDIQNVRQQSRVDADLLKALPTSTMTLQNLANLVPAIHSPSNIAGTAGFYNSNNVYDMNIHGKPSGAKVHFGDLPAHHTIAQGALSIVVNPETIEEYQVEAGGGTAEATFSGIGINVIPREGANIFAGSISGMGTGEAIQNDNLTQELRDVGLESANKAHYVWDANFSVGGPIVEDKLWFHSSYRQGGNKNQVAGIFYNADHGGRTFTPDLDRPGFRRDSINDAAVRITWQASDTNKIGTYLQVQKVCVCRGSGSFVAPEAQAWWNFWPQGIAQATWTSPVTNRLLLEAGWGAHIFHWPSTAAPESRPQDISNREQNINIRFNSGSFGNPRVGDRFSQRFVASYVTGSHTLKVGMQLQQAVNDFRSQYHQDIEYRVRNGVPNRLTMRNDVTRSERMKADLGLFIQDQWTIDRMTLNLGVRFEYLNSYVPEQTLAADRWSPARSFEAVHRVPEWRDINPRLGLAYDLFGDSRTALKASAGRYVGLQTVQLAGRNNPINTSFNSVNREWKDANDNFVPDCDLLNPAANGECGRFQNLNFGQSNPRATQYDDELLRGFGVREYTWDTSFELQQQVATGISITAGYYRNWRGNFTATDNTEVTPADFDSFCVNAPSDSRLPGGGGYEICGLADINPAMLGRVQNFVTLASNFGDHTYLNNFFGLTFDARLPSGIVMGGGLDTGRTVEDKCFVIDSPQALLHCRQVRGWEATTQVKFHGSLPLPGDVIVSGTFQNSPAALNSDRRRGYIMADRAYTRAEIGEFGGRTLARSTHLVPLVEPFTRYSPRRTQVDIRLTKLFQLGGAKRFDASMDIYNLLNASNVFSVNGRYGPAWLTPQTSHFGSAIMDGRLFAFNGRFSF